MCLFLCSVETWQRLRHLLLTNPDWSYHLRNWVPKRCDRGTAASCHPGRNILQPRRHCFLPLCSRSLSAADWHELDGSCRLVLFGMFPLPNVELIGNINDLKKLLIL